MTMSECLMPYVRAFFQLIAYTLPDGLRSINGSNHTGGCQEGCVMMPLPHTTINACDCPGTSAVTGVLVDGNTANIDITQHGMWARELFVVNKNGQNSIMIAFQFHPPFYLRNVQVTYLDCNRWGPGASTVNIAYSYSLLGFIPSYQIGTLSLNNDTFQNCTSLRAISIPVQPEGAANYYIHHYFLLKWPKCAPTQLDTPS